MTNQSVSMNINFDSLFFPLTIDRKARTDPSFFPVADRFFEFSNRYNFKYTIFIIGKDLENPNVAARVKSWAEAGHEIGNHSLTHNPNLGNLPKKEMEYEVQKSHEMIASCTGREPRGFISPSWSNSGELVEILMRLNYLYDTSIFPSYFQFLVLLKLKLMTAKHSNFHVSFRQRRDKKTFLFAPRRPYFVRPESLIKKQENGLLVIPIPVATPLRLPCWHTMYFVFGKIAMDWLIRRSIRKYDNFYYVMHPRDLLSYEDDISADLKKSHESEFSAFESLKVPIKEKLSYMEHALSILGNSGRKFITLEEMASKIYEEKKNKDNGGPGHKT